jgi:hypothetical protein
MEQLGGLERMQAMAVTVTQRGRVLATVARVAAEVGRHLAAITHITVMSTQVLGAKLLMIAGKPILSLIAELYGEVHNDSRIHLWFQ